MQLHVEQIFHLLERGDFFLGQLNFRKYLFSSFLMQPLAKTNNNKNNRKKGCGNFIIFSPQDLSMRQLVRILARSRSCHICTSSGDETDLVSSSFFSRFPLVHCIPLTLGVSWISVARDTFRQIKPACYSLIFHFYADQIRIH